MNDFIFNSTYYLATSVFTLISWNSFQLSPASGTLINWGLVAEREIRSEPQIESVISIFETGTIFSQISIILLAIVSFPAFWHLCTKYHARRLLLCFLVSYFMSFFATLVFSWLNMISSPVLIAILECQMSISRLFISASTSTFLMQLLSHPLPSGTVLYNPAFTLSISETISTLTTTGVTKGYSQIIVGS